MLDKIQVLITLVVTIIVTIYVIVTEVPVYDAMKIVASVIVISLIFGAVYRRYIKSRVFEEKPEKMDDNETLEETSTNSNQKVNDWSDEASSFTNPAKNTVTGFEDEENIDFD